MSEQRQEPAPVSSADDLLTALRVLRRLETTQQPSSPEAESLYITRNLLKTQLIQAVDRADAP